MRNVSSAVVVVLIAWSLLAAQPAAAAPARAGRASPAGGITVTTNGDDHWSLQEIIDFGFCHSPLVPDCSLRSAFTLALAGEGGVSVPSGVYVVGSSLMADTPAAAVNLSITGDGMDQTIIEGAGDRILYINAGGGGLALAGLTLRHGSTGGIGGAVYTNVATSLDHVRLLENNANNSGGGIAVVGLARLTIRNSEVLSNTATWGGGISTFDATSSLDMANTLVAYNVASNAGAGIDSVGEATIDASTITQNRASGPGGGLRALSSIILTNSTISDNRANNHGGGATLGNSSAPPGLEMTASIINTTISGNQDTYGNGGGGLSVWNNAKVTLANSTISGNSSTGKGGGIINGAIVEMFNSSVVGNSAPQGAGLLQMANITGSRTSLQNSVVAYNVSSLGLGDCSGVLQGGAYNFVQTVVAGECSAEGMTTGADPLLGPLQQNGGPTLTHLPADTSPLVNAGSPGGCYGPGNVVSRDQRSQPRPSGGGRCDIGAVEVQICVAPGVPNDVRAHPDGTNLVLTWTAAGSDLYEVWWSTGEFNLVPGASCAAAPGSCGTTTVPTFTHVGALAGVVPLSYSYLLVGRNSCGVAAATFSNHMGVISYTVAP